MRHSLMLAIDTSCDDTAAAVTSGTTILSNVTASQTQLHKEYGGVFPTVAKQAHKENIEPVIAVALKRARVSWSDITAIAVTQGPGLAPALEVGINKAIDLAKLHKKSLIAVNHLEGHLLSVLAKSRTQGKLTNGSIDKSKNNKDSAKNKLIDLSIYPALGLIFSGGNSLFVLVHDIGKYEVLGSTVDDAAGECLDKVGRMLGLGYPAGPVIEQFAKLGNSKAYQFPIPMTTSGDFNLSFSGLKTQARNNIEKLTKNGPLTAQETYDFCASFQFAVFRHITYKLEKILEKYPVNEVWLGGGVAANMELRRMLRATLKNIRVLAYSHTRKFLLKVPYTKKLTVDNAAMIGVAAGFKLEKKELVEDPDALERVPRMKL